MCIHVHTCTYIYIHVHTCTCASMYMLVTTCTYINMYIQGIERKLNAVLGRRLADVSQAEGAVSLEYLRGHVQCLHEAVVEAGQAVLSDEVLLDSAVAELELSKLMLVHAAFMQSCIDSSPLKGLGTGMFLP